MRPALLAPGWHSEWPIPAAKTAQNRAKNRQIAKVALFGPLPSPIRHRNASAGLLGALNGALGHARSDLTAGVLAPHSAVITLTVCHRKTKGTVEWP